MSKPFWGIEEQQERAKPILTLLVRDYLAHFDANGLFSEENSITGIRERLWFAYTFMAEGSEPARETANRIMEKSVYTPCHFSPKIAIQIWIKYEDRLSDLAKNKLWGYLEAFIEDSASDEMDFVGVNDNFPCMSTFIALIGGRLMGRPHLEAIGVKRLYQLKNMLTRRGLVSEFNSPTYSGIQLEALAELANFLEEGELRDIALQCEERIWADQMARLHLPTSQAAGPYSRAYTLDSVGHALNFHYYAVLGDRLPVNPLTTLFASGTPEPGQIVHISKEFMRVTTAAHLNAVYHCPVELVEHALHKSFPYEVRGTTEFSSSTDAHAHEDPTDPVLADDMTEYPAGVGNVTTYMTEDYALGTSTHEFHNGVQTDSFHLLYRPDPNDETSLHNARTVYAKYVVNEKKPGQANRYERMSITSNDDSLWDEGRKLAIQRKQEAMVLYKPKRFGRLQASSMKLAIVIPCPFHDPDEIWLGDQRLEALTGESKEPCPVYVKDGAVYMAFHPLILTNHGREQAIKVRRENRLLTVSFYNYEGEVKDFDPRTFVLTGNGFVVQVSSERESGSFEVFRERAGKARTRDRAFSSAHSRRTVIRSTVFESEDTKLACEYSPFSEGIKNIEVNGLVPDNEKLTMTGYDTGQLPFMNH